jgi:hypothetical protein
MRLQWLIRVSLCGALLLACGVVAQVWAQASIQQTSTISSGKVSLAVTATGVDQLGLSASSTIQNGGGLTCLTVTADRTTGEFCEDYASGASQYACTLQHADPAIPTITGRCTCSGTYAGLPSGCTELGVTCTY